jgi:hypothetical protein
LRPKPGCFRTFHNLGRKWFDARKIQQLPTRFDAEQKFVHMSVGDITLANLRLKQLPSLRRDEGKVGAQFRCAGSDRTSVSMPQEIFLCCPVSAAKKTRIHDVPHTAKTQKIAPCNSPLPVHMLRSWHSSLREIDLDLAFRAKEDCLCALVNRNSKNSRQTIEAPRVLV